MTEHARNGAHHIPPPFSHLFPTLLPSLAYHHWDTLLVPFPCTLFRASARNHGKLFVAVGNTSLLLLQPQWVFLFTLHRAQLFWGFFCLKFIILGDTISQVIFVHWSTERRDVLKPFPSRFQFHWWSSYTDDHPPFISLVCSSPFHLSFLTPSI